MFTSFKKYRGGCFLNSCFDFQSAFFCIEATLYLQIYVRMLETIEGHAIFSVQN